MSEAGKLSQCFKADGSVLRLMLVENKNMLVTITSNLMLTQHNISPSGDLKETIKVRPLARYQNCCDAIL